MTGHSPPFVYTVDSGTCKKNKRTDLEKLNANSPQSRLSDRRGAKVASEASPLASVRKSAAVLAKMPETGSGLTCGEGSRAAQDCGWMREGSTLQAAAEAMGAQTRGPQRPRIIQGGPASSALLSSGAALQSSKRCVGRPPRAAGVKEEPGSAGRASRAGFLRLSPPHQRCPGMRPFPVLSARPAPELCSPVLITSHTATS